MSEDWSKRIKKLALAYETGWEYMAKSDEAGSVLTDVFLEMEGKNRDRYRGMWKKHEREFLQAVPVEDSRAKRLRTALVVKASDRDNGKCLKKGTKAYTVLEKEGLIRFRTCSDLNLTSARLRYGVYKKGLSAWLAYDSAENGDGENSQPIRLFQAVGSELAHPIFEWSFMGLCDGRERMSVEVEFCGRTVLNDGDDENNGTAVSNGNNGIAVNNGDDGNNGIAVSKWDDENDGIVGINGIHDNDPDTGLSGRWSVTDGQDVYPLVLERTNTAFVLTGEMPGFAERLDETMYTIRLEFSAGQEPTQEWQEALCGDIILKEAAAVTKPELCLTDEGTEESGCVRPFGQALYETSCCYFTCDRAVAGRAGELEIKFTEEFETEEELPEPLPQEYEKLYKKYPWMRLEQTVEEWHAGNTVWEYFNGSLWRLLPGSGGWKTGCRPEKTGERVYRWAIPQDMQPCAIEGEIHYYIRMRLVSVCNAFAVYYHKHIPVMRDVCFRTGERILKPVKTRLPDRDEWQEAKMYLGFDRRVASGNIWFTGAECLVFDQGQVRRRTQGQVRRQTQEQVRRQTQEQVWMQTQGQVQEQGTGCVKQIRYEREAFWVEMEGGEAEDWEILLPNYVEILQEESLSGEDYNTHLQIPAPAGFSVEADSMEVLDAVSVSDARYNGDGPPIEERMRVRAAEHYFAHYGRLVTLYDMELLVQERYPFLQVESCALREDMRELQVSFRQVSDFQGGTQELILEINEWLKEALSRTGTLWLKGIEVNCYLHLEDILHNAEESDFGRV